MRDEDIAVDPPGYHDDGEQECVGRYEGKGYDDPRLGETLRRYELVHDHDCGYKSEHPEEHDGKLRRILDFYTSTIVSICRCCAHSAKCSLNCILSC